MPGPVHFAVPTFFKGVALCAVVGTPERTIPHYCTRLYASLNELVGQGFGKGL